MCLYLHVVHKSLYMKIKSEEKFPHVLVVLGVILSVYKMNKLFVIYHFSNVYVGVFLNYRGGSSNTQLVPPLLSLLSYQDRPFSAD